MVMVNNTTPFSVGEMMVAWWNPLGFVYAYHVKILIHG